MLEVKDAIFSTRPYKATRPNGFHPSFVHNSWYLFQDDILLLVSTSQCLSTRDLVVLVSDFLIVRVVNDGILVLYCFVLEL